MSDDRISRSPDPPRCPVCATGFTDAPGKACPACGREFALPPTTAPRDVRRRRSADLVVLTTGLVFAGLGAAFLVAVTFVLGLGLPALFDNLFGAPGVFIALAILSVPLMVCMVRLQTRNGASTSRASRLVGLSLASCGVALLAGLASVIALVVVCIATVNATTDKPFYDATPLSIGLGGAVGLTLFVVIFYRFAPQAPDEPPRDPEN